MSSSFQMGEKQGIKQGIEISRKVFRLHAQGKLPEEIARICSRGEEEVKEILFG